MRPTQRRYCSLRLAQIIEERWASQPTSPTLVERSSEPSKAARSFGWMGAPEWKLEFYEEDGREPVLDFLRGLGEVKEQALAAALRNVLAYEGIGVCGSSWGKWVQGAPGIFEFRVRHDAATILRAGLD